MDIVSIKLNRICQVNFKFETHTSTNLTENLFIIPKFLLIL